MACFDSFKCQYVRYGCFLNEIIELAYRLISKGEIAKIKC
jgi:hypothetical protein